MKTIKTKMNRPVIAAVTLAATLFAGGSQAAATLCSAPGAHPDGLLVTDVTFRNQNADDCYGVITTGPGGNVDGSNVWATTGWLALAKVDNGTSTSSTVNGIKFTLTADIGQNGQTAPGDWLLSWSLVPGGSPGFDLTMDIVANFKASNQSASYLFEDEMFTATPLSGAGTFKISYVNNGGQFPNLSNMSVWYQNPTHTDPGGPPFQVPEPNMILLMGIGLLGYGFTRIRKTTNI